MVMFVLDRNSGKVVCILFREFYSFGCMFGLKDIKVFFLCVVFRVISRFLCVVWDRIVIVIFDKWIRFVLVI